MATSAERLAAELADLRRRLVGIERGSQLGRSTFTAPDGSVMPVLSGVATGVQAKALAEDLADAQAILEAQAAERDGRLTEAEAELVAAANRLNEAEADLVAAFGRLDTAEGSLAAVPGDIDAAKAEAIAAAALDAQQKADAAKAAAEAAAALDAQAKADAAEAAATAAAALDAQAKADAAEQAAIDAAAVTAQLKADGAEQAAIDAAALDAQAKADAAKAAAEAAAAADATAKADAAEAAAIQAAATDAQAKADAAQAAAVAAAAIDAQNKADAAEQAAIEAAALDAQARADTARQAAIDAAAADAAAKAAQAEADALAQAALDAQAKADAAEQAAIDAAAITAQAKADAARDGAISAAEADATAKADAAEAAAKADAAAAQSAADAAAQAASAAQADADAAATAAATAQSRADAAHALAGTAESNAQAAITAASNAQNTADNVAKNLFSTNTPAGTAPYGSTWFRVNGTGEVIGQWQQTAAGIASTWTPRPIRSEVIANLDVGKLTAGTATILNAVAEKIAASTAAIQKADIGNLTVTGTSTMAQAVIDKLFADVVVAKTAVADAFIGENAILSGAVKARMLESELVLASKILAGDPEGTHAEMSPQGFRVFSADPTDGIPNEVVRMGVAATDDFFAVSKSDGSLAATISQDGVGSFDQVNAPEIFLGGESLSEILWNMPRGHIGSAFRTTYSAYNSVAGQPRQPYLRFDVELQDGRLYKISTSQIRMGVTVGGNAVIYLHGESGGGPATEYSAILTYAEVFREAESQMLAELYTPSLNGAAIEARGKRLCSFLISFSSNTGEAGVRANDQRPVRLLVEDVGPLINTHPGTWLDGANQTPPPPQYVNYTRQYGCTNSMNYQGNNSQYNYNTQYMFQGLSPAGYGNLKSIGLFPDMTGDLSGSTINYVRVYFNFPHWYYNSGGTARIGLHGHTGIPGSFSHAGVVVSSGGWPKPGARWVDIPSQYWDGFKTGAYRGVSLEGDGSYGTYGYADRPTLEISFTK